VLLWRELSWLAPWPTTSEPWAGGRCCPTYLTLKSMQSLDPRLMIALIRPVLNRRGSEEPIKDYKLISKAGRTKTLDATLIRIPCFKYSMDLCQPCSELIQWIASLDLRDSVFEFERNLSHKTCYLCNELAIHYLRLSREEERNGNYVLAQFEARRICGATEDTRNLVCARQGQYCALSHCWGAADKRPLRTTQANLHSHLTGIPFTQLPKTFKDAVLLTRSI